VVFLHVQVFQLLLLVLQDEYLIFDCWQAFVGAVVLTFGYDWATMKKSMQKVEDVSLVLCRAVCAFRLAVTASAV
jgi:hypothetical protein